MSDDLPNGIPEILEYLARTARGHDNHLKSNEVAKLKADLMNVRSRWLEVSVSEIADRCRALGMGDGDVATVTDLVQENPATAASCIRRDDVERDRQQPDGVALRPTKPSASDLCHLANGARPGHGLIDDFRLH